MYYDPKSIDVNKINVVTHQWPKVEGPIIEVKESNRLEIKSYPSNLPPSDGREAPYISVEEA